jgi:hypothetical protein
MPGRHQGVLIFVEGTHAVAYGVGRIIGEMKTSGCEGFGYGYALYSY